MSRYQPTHTSNKNSNESNFETWSRLWLILSVISAFAVTLMDSALLQRKFNFFTGGFLSVYHLRGIADTVMFVVISLIADLALIMPLVALVLCMCSFIRLNHRASVIAVIAVATGPIITANFIIYRILKYVGDAFDLTLAFEIAGRNLNEIITVASTHLFTPAALLVGAVGFIVVLVWGANGYWKAPLPQRPTIFRIVIKGVAIFAVGLLITSVAIVSSDQMKYGLRKKVTVKLLVMVGETVTDVDKDGYGLLRGPADPNPFNPRIYPYAVEIPGNGIDENGVAGDLAPENVSDIDYKDNKIQWKSHPNIIFIILESFRADLIRMKYDKKEITPELNRLANEGVFSELAFTNTGYTVPSRYHFFSGRLSVSGKGTTLIDDFKANGYEVAFFSAQDVLFGEKKYDIGFNRADVAYDARVDPQLRFTSFSTAGSIALPYNVIIEKVNDFLSRRHDKSPLFLYVNLQDTHFPYHHKGIRPLINQAALPRSEIGPDRAADLWATYVNTVANVDFAIGEILKSARRFLGDKDLGIIVAGDHGESLYDDGFLGHGFVINDIQTRIPLIIVDLPIVIEQPFGQIQLRNALNKALAIGSKRPRAPVLTLSNDENGVFQYLGNFRRPLQIALRRIAGKIVYDFRTNRIQISDGAWKRPGQLTEKEFSAFKNLINLWEKMIIASYGSSN